MTIEFIAVFDSGNDLKSLKLQSIQHETITGFTRCNFVGNQSESI
jgi:hypothetical protein